MKLEVLISTMNQKNFDLIYKMNLKSDAIIINQCNEFKKEEMDLKENKIKMYSFDEKGIGLSRNNALMRSTGDICIFADDDVEYLENYKEIIISKFSSNLSADIIVFNVESLNKNRPSCHIKKDHRVRLINSLKYGAVNIAFRREKIIKKNVYFSLLFGGGAKYSSGEDSLFIYECLKKNLKIYATSEKIANVTQETSTWFNGYTDKYFIDKGVFFKALSQKWSKLYIFQFVIRKYSKYKKYKNLKTIMKLMVRGEKEFNDKY